MKFAWCPRHPPADDAAGIGVDDEGDVGKARPGDDIGEVGDPEPVRCRNPEVAVYPVERTGAALSLIVVLTDLPRTIPCRPIWRIRRATVHRATAIPSRPS